MKERSMIEFTLNLVEGDKRLQICADAPCSGEGRRSLPARDVEALKQIQAAAGNLKEGSSAQELEKLGRRLFSTVIQGQVREVFESARAVARKEEKLLLVLVKMDPGSLLHLVPWELLHDGFAFLAKDVRSAVVRYFDQPLPVPALAVAPPLRVLVTSASPAGLEPVSRAEEDAVRRAYKKAGKLVHLVCERHVSIEKLKAIWFEACREGNPFHVWQHCGHGQIRGEGTEFFLCLENEGRNELVDVDRLQEVISFCPELRVAILNICRGGSLGGLAPALARLNVPVVIGFQRPVYDTAALELTEALHACLLDMPVELATSLARKSMKVNEPDIFDWAHAITFSRRRDRGRILQEPADSQRNSQPTTNKVNQSIGIIEGSTVTMNGIINKPQ